jgi:two-component system response regulator AtoC
MPRFYVVIRHHDGTEEVRELAPGRLVIGRESGSWLSPLDPALSRRHAALLVDGDRVTLECLPSRNGTFLNGARVEGTLSLAPLDEVRAGRTVVRLCAGAPSVGRRHQATVELPPDGAARPIGVSRAFVELLERAEKVASSELPIVITGESGTGKELLARHIHACSPRHAGPFQVLNCPALPPTLVESELFGVEAGVATGVSSRPGLLEQADGGTILLDEVGDLPPEVQAKLLRFLQELTVTRVGGRKATRVNARVLAATNRDLDAAIATGGFRSDLYYRLAGVTLRIPPLRERPEDIPPLAAFFLERFAPAKRLSADALRALKGHGFPGNVRELETIVRRSALLAKGDEIQVADVGLAEAGPRAAAEDAPRQAERLLRAVVAGEADFWCDVHGPFVARELPRPVLKALVAAAWEESGGSVKRLASYLHVVDRYRKLLDFLRNNRLMPGD